jgi:hypothetical protein
MRRPLVLLCVLAALVVPSAARAGSTMFVGAVENAPLAPTLAEAKAKVDLARLAGFDTLRVGAFWGRGRASIVPKEDLVRLQNAATAAQLDGMRLIVSVSNDNSKNTPNTPAYRDELAIYTLQLARALPTVTDFIIGNEPNLNMFWLPQFSKPVYGTKWQRVRVHGKLVRTRVRYLKKPAQDVAAPAYLALLAKTYDLLKDFNPQINVIGVALSPRGGDNPTGIRPTHSPTTFLLDLGKAYRASHRTTPIMDALAFHPYPEASKIPPTLAHPRSKNIGLADYAKLTQTLGQAFNGTAQPGSSLPIVYDEFGVQSAIPSSQRNAYENFGAPLAKDAVSEATQATYYRQALTMAYCQPNVEGLLIFHVSDESNLAAWQSGLFYANDKPKSSLPAVRAAFEAARDGTLSSCAAAHASDFLDKVTIPPKDKVPADNTSWGGDLTCKNWCTFEARIEEYPSGDIVSKIVADAPPDHFTPVVFPEKTLDPGKYRIVVRVWAYRKIGTSVVRYGDPFTVEPPTPPTPPPTTPPPPTGG